MGCGVRHAGCGVCAPAARGRDREREDRAESRERRQRGGQSSRLPREDDPSWYGYGCFPVQRGDLPQRHASSRRLRHRPRAYHGLLPRHRQRQGMLHVPPRHQPRRSLIKAVLRGGLFCCLSARSVRRLYMPVFLFFARSVSLHEIIVPLRLRKWGERKNTSFLHLVDLFSTTSYFPVNRLPLRYPWASFACRVMARGVGGLPLRCPLSTRGRSDPRVRHTRVIRNPISCSP